MAHHSEGSFLAHAASDVGQAALHHPVTTPSGTRSLVVTATGKKGKVEEGR